MFAALVDPYLLRMSVEMTLPIDARHHAVPEMNLNVWCGRAGIVTACKEGVTGSDVDRLCGPTIDLVIDATTILENRLGAEACQLATAELHRIRFPQVVPKIRRAIITVQNEVPKLMLRRAKAST